MFAFIFALLALCPAEDSTNCLRIDTHVDGPTDRLGIYVHLDDRVYPLVTMSPTTYQD